MSLRICLKKYSSDPSFGTRYSGGRDLNDGCGFILSSTFHRFSGIPSTFRSKHHVQVSPFQQGSEKTSSTDT